MTEVKPSPVRGLYQALVRTGKDNAIIYDYAKKHLLNARIFDTDRKADVTQEDLTNSKRINPADVKLDNALVMGNPAGKKVLQVFTDSDCPYCAQLHHELMQLVKDDPEFRVNIHLFPLDIHPDAAGKIDSVICSAKSSMNEALSILDQNFAKQSIKLSDYGKLYAKAGTNQAAELGITVTPTIILPDGRLIIGMKKAEELKLVLTDHAVTAMTKE